MERVRLRSIPETIKICTKFGFGAIVRRSTIPFEIVQNDIVNMQVDAVINTVNPNPVIGSGIDSGIHKKAGHGDTFCLISDFCDRVRGNINALICSANGSKSEQSIAF